MTVKNCRTLGESSYSDVDGYEGVILVLPSIQDKEKKYFVKVPDSLPDAWTKSLLAIAEKTEVTGKPGDKITFDASPDLRVSAIFLDDHRSMFDLLADGAALIGKISENGARKLLVDIRLHPHPDNFADAICSAITIKNYSFQKYGQKSKKERSPVTGDILVLDTSLKLVDARVSQMEQVSHGTNLVRQLTTRAANDLTPANYISEVRKKAQIWKIDCEVFGFDRLKEMKAGAFIAVAQASPAKDAGIVQLVYNKESKGKHICFVGKGVTFDTGGNNLKPASYMFGMEGDMAGSAVSLALFELAVTQKWDCQVSCFLAISDNLIGNEAYRPNDVVTAMNGKTIEVVHTDAEGRMLLADTLHLASQDKPDLMIDFATLTGSCVGAIGSAYAGAFTNHPSYHQALIKAGVDSGERIWPFPLDDDFGKCLESDVADIKQCRLKGGVDHIEAAYFLKEFVGKDLKWIHIDLSAAHNTGGLAHVESDVTGFGVRVISRFLESVV